MHSATLLLAAAAAAVLSVLQVDAVGFDQSASVVGTLMCNGRPATNVMVKLYDDDTGPDLDDFMAEGTTDAQGRFSLSGWTDETMTIDPKVNIYHDCNDGITPCQRRISVFVPSSYVSNGQRPTKTYNVGTIELAGQFSGEERDCLNKKR